MSTTPADRRGFDRAAWFYEPLARLHSGGQIAAAKASQVELMNPGDKVLYVGVGGGEDALLAARRGVALTAIDLSAGMLRRAEAKLAREGLSAELIRGDARGHDRPGRYDVVTANFFLNCFAEPDMVAMLRHLASLVRPGGRLMIADVAVPRGGLPSRAFQRLHYGTGLWLFWTLGLVPWHPIYDYRRHLREAGLRVEEVRSFRLFKVGPPCYWSIAAVRPPEGATDQEADAPRSTGP